MSTHALECYTDFHSFQAIRAEWEEFTARYFPEQYARTHGWLSAWWKTYHCGQAVLVYVQRDVSDGRIVAVAPLFICRENFGGFPVRSVVSLGRGIGSDDFLVSGDSSCFVENVIKALLVNSRWDIAIFRRIGIITSVETITDAAEKFHCTVESIANDDYLIDLPESFDVYFKGLSKNFRQNLRTASNRMHKAGTVSTKILNPLRDNLHVIDVGMEIAKTSWQYKEGKSHFNATGAGSFYHNLASEYLAEGLEFNVLYLNEIPVSYLLGYHRWEKYYVIDIAYHGDYRFYSAGNILYLKVIERLIGKNAVKQIDLEGAGEYKDDFANAKRRAYSLTLFNKSAYARLIRAVRKSDIYESLKNKIKNSFNR